MNEPNGAPELFEVPLTRDGDPDLTFYAIAILEVAMARPNGEGGWVSPPQAFGPETFRYIHFRGGVIVELACLANPFNASLYMALEQQDASRVMAWATNHFSQVPFLKARLECLDRE
jgi:hypothetical protein